MNTSLADRRLYLCTPDRPDLAKFLEACIVGGVDIVQLREKGMEAGEELEHLQVFAEAARRHGRLLAVNDRADVARTIGADVLHLGQGDLPVPAARTIIGEQMLIGRCTHAVPEVEDAMAEPGSDYFCTGPVWPTPTKPGRPAPGLDLVRWTAARAPRRPWFAIGGITPENLPEVQSAGATRIAVSQAVCGSDSPGEIVTKFKEALAEGSRQRAVGEQNHGS